MDAGKNQSKPNQTEQNSFQFELSKPRLKLLNWYLVKYRLKTEIDDAFYMIHNTQNPRRIRSPYVQT